MLHFFEKSHNSIFTQMIRKKFKNFEKIEEELKSFWLSMMENEIWEKLLNKEI
jgi:predicted metal-dependent hydrolase